jgi:lysophospholipase L1-like esterase
MKTLKLIFRSIRDIWAIIGIALAIFIAIEGGISLGFYIRSFWHTPDPNFRNTADTYTDRTWAAKYYKEIDEFEQSRTMRWQPYVYWRRIPRNGEYINITSDGLRKTNNFIDPETTGPTMKVFIFGGSTIWGLGVEDKHTIPSIFAKEVKSKGVNCEVTNFGQYAYVSTQEVIELILQLQKGNIPDAVIFYDGVNDTFGAFQLGIPGLPFDEIRREKEFNILESNELQTLAVQAEIKRLSTVRFLNGALKKFNLRRDNFQSIPLQYEKPISDREALARAVVDTYFNNIKLVQALSKSYGFTCQFYWQPVIYLKQHLTEYERKSVELDFNYPGMKEFYLATYDSLRQRAGSLKNNEPFHDISSIFGEIREPIFVDFNHMGEKGNSLIAKRMVDDFAHLVKVNSKSTKQNHVP